MAVQCMEIITRVQVHTMIMRFVKERLTVCACCKHRASTEACDTVAKNHTELLLLIKMSSILHPVNWDKHEIINVIIVIQVFVVTTLIRILSSGEVFVFHTSCTRPSAVRYFDEILEQKNDD